MLTTLHAIWTVILLVAFLGIVVWAFSSRRKAEFDEAARLVLDDSDAPGEGKDG